MMRSMPISPVMPSGVSSRSCSAATVAGRPTRDHWAFMPPERPAVPRGPGIAWVRNPIDAFILARLEDRPAARARGRPGDAACAGSSFDLTGLPPTPD